MTGKKRIGKHKWSLPVWDIYCEGERVGLSSDERRDRCVVSFTRITPSGIRAWSYARKKGWELAGMAYACQVCPGCAKVLIATHAAKRVELEDGSQTMLFL